MKNIFLSLALCLTFYAHASVMDIEDTAEEAKAFMLRIKGKYDVLTVNGVKPHSNNAAEISMDDPDISDWSMPYCLSDFSCLPGFISFSFANTQVVEKRSSPTEATFFITLTENNLKKNFIWREEKGRIFFRNPQYELPGHQTADLEHELRRRN